jgi:hypothetical protein
MSKIQEQTYTSSNGQRMLTFSFLEDSFHVSHAYWTKNKKAIVGDMLFTLTVEEAVRTAELILDRYKKHLTTASTGQGGR